MDALQSGVSGMLANQTNLDAIGNDIANSNTTAFKSESVNFSDALYQTLSEGTTETNPSSVGQGVSIADTSTNFAQGSLTSTGRATDVAIQGTGFIAVTNGSQIFYTRDGGLGVDSSGNLIQLSSGMKVITVPSSAASSSGVNVTPTSTLQAPIGEKSSASATANITLAGNLDSSTAAAQPYQMTATVYDSLGSPHAVDLTFTPSATAGTWQVSGTSTDGAVAFAAPGQVAFDSNGNPTTPNLAMTLTLTNPNGAKAAMPMNVSVGNMTQLADTSTAALVTQDGAPPGTLTGITINGDGTVSGNFSNGLTTALGKIPTAIFSNDGGLLSKGGNLYTTSPSSGQAQYGVAGTGGRGTLANGQLESSNVNLEQEFADMIVTQRDFQASSRIVTTSDQMMQALLQISQ